jgi:hypothetical protein
MQTVNEEILAAQRKRHSDLIQQLKTQLEELESYAYASGEAIVPSNLLLDKQKFVMGECSMGGRIACSRVVNNRPLPPMAIV